MATPKIPTLLSSLREFQKIQEHRQALSAEIESALASFLTNTPSQISNLVPTGSTCSNEAVRPPTEIELGEVLRIGLTGLLEIKDEAEEVAAVVRVLFKREDLADVLAKIEGLETERLKETLQRDQFRRLAVLEPERDFKEAIAAHNSRRRELEAQINEETQEITAELADLSAAEADA